jgi:hypothetical protein
MKTEQITIHVDAEAARIFNSASEADRRKLEVLISLRLIEAARTNHSLREVMSEISHNVQERGLTPEVLDSMVTDASCR